MTLSPKDGDQKSLWNLCDYMYDMRNIFSCNNGRSVSYSTFVRSATLLVTSLLLTIFSVTCFLDHDKSRSQQPIQAASAAMSAGLHSTALVEHAA